MKPLANRILESMTTSGRRTSAPVSEKKRKIVEVDGGDGQWYVDFEDLMTQLRRQKWKNVWKNEWEAPKNKNAYTELAQDLEDLELDRELDDDDEVESDYAFRYSPHLGYKIWVLAEM